MDQEYMAEFGDELECEFAPDPEARNPKRYGDEDAIVKKGSEEIKDHGIKKGCFTHDDYDSEPVVKAREAVAKLDPRLLPAIFDECNKKLLELSPLTKPEITDTLAKSVACTSALISCMNRQNVLQVQSKKSREDRAKNLSRVQRNKRPKTNDDFQSSSDFEQNRDRIKEGNIISTPHLDWKRDDRKGFMDPTYVPTPTLPASHKFYYHRVARKEKNHLIVNVIESMNGEGWKKIPKHLRDRYVLLVPEGAEWEDEVPEGGHVLHIRGLDERKGSMLNLVDIVIPYNVEITVVDAELTEESEVAVVELKKQMREHDNERDERTLDGIVLRQYQGQLRSLDTPRDGQVVKFSRERYYLDPPTPRGAPCGDAWQHSRPYNRQPSNSSRTRNASATRGRGDEDNASTSTHIQRAPYTDHSAGRSFAGPPGLNANDSRGRDMFQQIQAPRDAIPSETIPSIDHTRRLLGPQSDAGTRASTAPSPQRIDPSYQAPNNRGPSTLAAPNLQHSYQPDQVSNNRGPSNSATPNAQRSYQSYQTPSIRGSSGSAAPNRQHKNRPYEDLNTGGRSTAAAFNPQRSYQPNHAPSNRGPANSAAPNSQRGNRPDQASNNRGSPTTPAAPNSQRSNQPQAAANNRGPSTAAASNPQYTTPPNRMANNQTPLKRKASSELEGERADPKNKRRES